MLLEQIIPGDNLLFLEDSYSWLENAAELVYKLPAEIDISLQCNTKGSKSFISPVNFSEADRKEEASGLTPAVFPHYADWLKGAFPRARREKKVDEELLDFIKKAEYFFLELEERNYQPRLLHGDLHHWNILRSANRGWQAIDPKGVIGQPLLESARFLDNQITLTDSLGDHAALDGMLGVFSRKFSASKLQVVKSLFILLVLSTCWSHENHSPKPSTLQHRQDKCRFVDDYIEKKT